MSSSASAPPGPDRYVVIGNPIAHSLSPAIHARFAVQLGERIAYSTLLAPREDFAGATRAFFAGGGRGASVTLPFKLDACRFADSLSERARLAGAVNVLAAHAGGIEGDNTDGAGLVADLATNQSRELRGARILLIGAGGAARGVLAPLLGESPALLAIANRSPERARELAGLFANHGHVEALALEAIAGRHFDLVINATSSSTHGSPLELPEGIFAGAALAYDMAYGPAALPFLEGARQRGAAAASDGLGMLVEQAALSYFLWRGLRPDTAPVIAAMRSAR